MACTKLDKHRQTQATRDKLEKSAQGERGALGTLPTHRQIYLAQRKFVYKFVYGQDKFVYG